MRIVPKDQIADAVKWAGMEAGGYPGWVTKLMVERYIYKEGNQDWLIQTGLPTAKLNIGDYILRQGNGRVAKLPPWLFRADYEVIVSDFEIPDYGPHTDIF